MSKTIFVKNPSGRIVDVDKDYAEENLLTREGYEVVSGKEAEAAKKEIYGIESNPRYSDADKAMDENPPAPVITEVKEKEVEFTEAPAESVEAEEAVEAEAAPAPVGEASSEEGVSE